MADYLMCEGPDSVVTVKGGLSGPDMPVDIAKLAFEASGHLTPGDGTHLSKSNVGPVSYHPRMGRRLVASWSNKLEDLHGPLRAWQEKGIPPHPRSMGALADGMNQIAGLVRSLTSIFETVSPTQSNLGAYGSQIGNALLLAAIAFENECKGVLRANSFALGDRPTTTQYAKVKGPLRLEEYSVSFPFYPMIGIRGPLIGWDEGRATQSLPWYDSYNQYKHDRYLNAEKATVDVLIDAVAAVAIMMAAQYRVIPSWNQRVGEFFKFETHPNWGVEDAYVVPFNPADWVAKEYAF